jgi:oleate hydratase
MSIVLSHQPYFMNQPADVQVFSGCSRFSDRVGDFVPEPMGECHGAEILHEICRHLRLDLETMELANRIPCRMREKPTRLRGRLGVLWRTDLAAVLAVR